MKEKLAQLAAGQTALAHWPGRMVEPSRDKARVSSPPGSWQEEEFAETQPRRALGHYLINGRRCELHLDQEGLSWSRVKWSQKKRTTKTKTKARNNSNKERNLLDQTNLNSAKSEQHDRCDQEQALDNNHESLQSWRGAQTAARHKQKHRLDFDRLISIKETLDEGSSKGSSDTNKNENNNKNNNKDTNKIKIYYAKQTDQKLLKLKRLSIGQLKSAMTFEPIELRRLLELQLEARRGQRPSRLLVFVNPFGGEGKALNIYKSQVRRLFDLANIDVRLIVTQYANHARDTIEDGSCDIDSFDGVVCVGGDGMFSELMNGLLFRYNKPAAGDRRFSSCSSFDGNDGSSVMSTKTTTTTTCASGAENYSSAGNAAQGTTSASSDQLGQQPSKAFVSPPVPLGVIGAGSTDANSFGLLGTNDVATATLNIIFGKQIQIDACSLHSIEDNDRLLRFVSTFAAYGYFGDVARESEKLRWLGPSRYDLTGISSLIKNRSYEGVVRILVSAQDGSPLDQQRCHSNCAQCVKVTHPREPPTSGLAPKQAQDVLRANTRESQRLEGGEAKVGVENYCNENPPVTRNDNQDCNRGSEKISQSCERKLDFRRASSESAADSLVSNSSSASSSASATSSSSNSSLRLIERRGAFVGVNAAVMACRCPQTRKGFSPSNHLANGCADLILVRPCSRLQYVNYLLRTGWSKKSAFDLKFVEAYRCRQFEFIAGTGSRSARGKPAKSSDGSTATTSSCSNSSTTSSSSAWELSESGTGNGTGNGNGNATSLGGGTTGEARGHKSLGLSSTQVDKAKRTKGRLPRGQEGNAPDLGAKSSWNVDGEVLEEPSIRVRVNNRLLRVFGTGEPQ